MLPTYKSIGSSFPLEYTTFGLKGTHPRFLWARLQTLRFNTSALTCASTALAYVRRTLLTMREQPQWRECLQHEVPEVRQVVVKSIDRPYDAVAHRPLASWTGFH